MSGGERRDPLGDVREGGSPPSPWRSAPGRTAVRLVVRAATWVTPHGVLGWTLVLELLVVGVLTGLSAQVYESVVEEDGVATLDRPVLRAAVAIRNPTLTTVLSAYTNLGDVTGLTTLTVLVGVGLALAWRRWTPVVLLAVTGAGSVLLTVVGKGVVGRDRPPADLAVVPLVDSPAFPSGHTLNSTAIAGVVAYLLVRRLQRTWAQVLAVTLAAAFAGVMGLTRVYLGQHWLTDVLAAYCLGLAWAACVVTAHRLYLTAARERRGARGSPGP